MFRPIVAAGPQHRHDIDGLRAFAVLAVVLYHAKLGFSGGYLGVDVFFVISGFLITKLISEQMSKGKFSYRDFWFRRIRRLVPALLVVTAFVALTSPLVLLPQDLQDLGGALVAQPLLLANVYFWRVVQGGYFGDPAETRPLLHTWSLGVEEQFYVLYPILMALLFRIQTDSRRKVWLVLATGASFALSVGITPLKPVLSFFTLPTRAWEMLLGGLVALTPIEKAPRALKEPLGWLGLLSIVACSIFYDHHMEFPGSAALAPCLGTAALLWANSGGPTRSGRLLAIPLLRWVGLSSYSIYLWHWPLVAYGFYTGNLGSYTSRFLVVAASLAVGYLSYVWIENPCRRSPKLAASRTTIALYALYLVGCLSLGSLFYATQGLPQNWSPRAMRLYASKDDRGFRHVVEPDDPNSSPGVLGRESSSTTDFLLWGDSHGISLAPVLDSLGKRYAVKGLQVTHNGKAALAEWDFADGRSAEVSPEFKEKWFSMSLEIAKTHRVKVVFLCGYWSIYARPSFRSELEQTARAFQSQGVEVVFVLDVPTQKGNPPRDLALAQRWPKALPLPTTEAEHRHANQVVEQAVREIAAAEPGLLTVVDPALLVLKWETLQVGDHALYLDQDHLSDTGALLLAPIFEPLFQRL